MLLWLGYKNKQAARQQQKWTLQGELPNLSIIVAFRNEEMSIPQLLEGLGNLNYPNEKLEIILINDHSEDSSAHLVNHWISKNNNRIFKLFHSPEGKTGKKAALEFAVKNVSGDWLLFTDADCEIHPNWPNQMVVCQQNSGAEMVCGQVAIKVGNWKENLEALEFSSLIAVGASGITINKPSLCNGANFMISRSAHQEAQLLRSDQNLASGDDVFLLHTLKKLNRRIVFCFVPFSEILINPTDSWNTFEQQRLRWASKWKSGLSGGNQNLAIVVWFFHLLFLATLCGLLWNLRIREAFFITVLKAAIESQFLELFLPHRSYIKSMNYILWAQFLYSFYVIYFGLKVLFSNQYTWKGRPIRY